MRVCICVLLVLCAHVAAAEQPSKEAVAKAYAKIKDEAKKEYDQEVANLENRFKDASKTKAPERFTLKKQLDAKRKEPPKAYLPSIRPKSIALDDVGVLAGDIKIMSVASPTEALAVFELGKSEETVWVSGVNTSNMVSDTTYDFDRTWFWVSGTKTYTTVLGASKKVLILQAIDAPQR